MSSDDDDLEDEDLPRSEEESQTGGDDDSDDDSGEDDSDDDGGDDDSEDGGDDDPDLALFEAIRAGDPGAVTRALEDGADPDALDEDGVSALRAAQREGHRPIFALLLDAGAHLDADCEKEGSDLHEAIRTARVDILREVNARDPESCAVALHHAVFKDDGAGVTALLDAGVDADARAGGRAEHRRTCPLAARDKDMFEGQTPLQLAAALGRVEIARLLLARGADAGATQDDGSDRTALHKAAASGRVEVVEQLLAAGANVDATDAWFETPLCKATRLAADRRDGDAREPHLAAAARLLDRGAGFSFGYCGQRHMFEDMPGQALSFVLEHQWAADRGARVREETSRPLLVWAARHGSLDLVTGLLARGADPAETDASGATALHAAAERGAPALVEALERALRERG